MKIKWCFLLTCICSLSILINIPSFVKADPSGSSPELGLALPVGCQIIGGDYSQAGTEKCVIDGLTGQSSCYLAKVNCCGNGSIDQDLYDANPPFELIHESETCEPNEAGCRSNCTQCGDSRVDADYDEDCDKGVVNGTQGSNCTAQCLTPDCGNGVREIENTNPVEQCDGGSFNPSDSGKVLKVCDENCLLHYCGDGQINNTESCDGNTYNAAHQSKPGLICDGQCNVHFCGDGFVDQAPNCTTTGGASCSEQCDDGNPSNNDTCTNLCYTARCGDGFVQGAESCDGAQYAAAYQASIAKSCDAQCQVHYCGDGVLDAGEQCDDANQADNDGCTTTCRIARCGDGIVTAGEACDDGENSNDGSCSADCTRACGWDYVTWWYAADHYPCWTIGNNCTGATYTWCTDAHPSPISLLTYSDVTLDDLSPTKVRFKLDEQQLEPETYWFGSGFSPLLVYDPAKSGQVKDGRALFGTWFNGQRWSNGYEALASLDKDSNASLEGEELNGIRLWYDFNADAIVDPLEIQDLAAKGINKLSVVYDSRQENAYGAAFLISNNGYQQSKDGKTSSGVSFDWFVPNVKTLEAGPKLDVLAKDGYKVVKWREVPLEGFYNDFNGYLVYKINGQKITGFHLSAGSFVNSGLKHSPIAQMPFTATKVANGEYELEFGTKMSRFHGRVKIDGDNLIPTTLTIKRKNVSPPPGEKGSVKAVTTKDWAFDKVD